MKRRSEKWTGGRLRNIRLRKSRLASAVQSPPRRPALDLADQELAPVLEGHDGTSLARAKTQWFFGEWGALAAIDARSLQEHPNRDRFALLIASAHQQLGNHEKARSLARQALEWGCPPRAVAQVLIAGVHNTLGKVAALKEDEPRMAHHFSAAVAVADGGESALASHTRSVREMARLGLLPQAATLLDKELQAARSPAERPQRQEAHIKVLETEMELLRFELSLAQQRRQLYRGPVGEAPPRPDPGNPEWLKWLKTRAVSQLGQDLWVLERTGYKRGGFFVEFGATDGVMLSNTWLLEKEFGWEGACAEPNPKFFKELQRNRDCTVSNACIGARTGEKVEFVFAAEYGGMRKHAKLDNNAERRSGYLAEEENHVLLETISLDDFLVAMNAPRRIDYLSIDTEGSELEILSAFPWDEWRIDLITVEHNFTPEREKLRALLESRGYSRIEAEWDDWYYREG